MTDNIMPTQFSASTPMGDLGPLDNIRGSNISGKEQLKKVSKEFEAIFVAKMMETLDKTVDKENSLFQDSKYQDTFKSIMYTDMGRQIANNPHTSIGLAKQLYQQMERSIPE